MAAMDPPAEPVSTQSAPSTSLSESVPREIIEMTPTGTQLPQAGSLPVVTEAVSGQPATCQSGSTFIVVLESILIVIFFVTHLGLSLALFASIGAVLMLAGNGIVNQTTKNNASAASVGVVGGLILFPPLCLLYLLIPTEPGVPRYMRFDRRLIAIVIPSVTISAVTGVIGSAVLLEYNVDLGGIDIINALLAGIAAGSLFAIVEWVFRFSLICLLSSILSPIWSVITRIDELEPVNEPENGTGGSHSHSNGSRRDDPESNADMQNLPGRD